MKYGIKTLPGHTHFDVIVKTYQGDLSTIDLITNTDIERSDCEFPIFKGYALMSAIVKSDGESFSIIKTIPRTDHENELTSMIENSLPSIGADLLKPNTQNHQAQDRYNKGYYVRLPVKI